MVGEGLTPLGQVRIARRKARLNFLPRGGSFEVEFECGKVRGDRPGYGSPRRTIQAIPEPGPNLHRLRKVVSRDAFCGVSLPMEV